MKPFGHFCRKPLGQVLLATLFFCFIFVMFFAGLYKAGTAYLLKEKSQVATDMTALTAGAVYANGLQQVRYANAMLMVLAAIDAAKAAAAMAPFLELPPPANAGAIGAAKLADAQNLRRPFQNCLKVIFGIEEPLPGVYPILIEGQAIGTGGENGLALTPFYLYNHETAGNAAGALLPNMALRFRRGSELVPLPAQDIYSLLHDGERHYFSSEQVEPAHNPRFPRQMRVKKSFSRRFGGMWVRREKNVTEGGSLKSPFTESMLRAAKEFLDQFKLDVVDRDDPPCHTFALLGILKGRVGGGQKDFYQTAEVRVIADGLAGWDSLKPIDVTKEPLDLEELPMLPPILKNKAVLIGP
jgi:hypothetical protein